ncbi:MAG: PTS sugar transporter subunit IIA [Streptococcaceae bacterium]|jgi:mannose/fructose-specific phosphotransferase system component IIA|nr:PTS sugar transporter subunit IIA [Streptococcaceae bacterium]
MRRKILILTHGKFAEGIADSLRMISGIEEVSRISIAEDDSPEDVRSQISAFIASAEEDSDIIVLTDIQGGSSTQAAFPFLQTQQNLHLVTGLNLGLLLEIVLSTEENTAAGIEKAVENAKSSIVYLNKLLDKVVENDYVTEG